MFREVDKKAVVTRWNAYNKTGRVEIEIRFTEMSMPKGRSGVTSSTFTRVLNAISRKTKSPIVWNETKEYLQIMSGVTSRRILKVDRRVPETQWEEKWQQKRSVLPMWNRAYMAKLAVSIEEDIPRPSGFQPRMTREKRRASFKDGNITVDLTIVNTRNIGVRGRMVTYEVELEINDPVHFEELNRKSVGMVSLIQDSVQPYSEDEYHELIRHVNTTLGSSIWDKKLLASSIDSRVMTKPRNLHYGDLVYGGLVGNELTSYWALHKTDGERKLLVVHNNIVWLAMHPNSLNKLATIGTGANHLNGYIFDGEFIPKSARRSNAPSNDIYYLIFDTLSIPSIMGDKEADTSVMRKRFVKRLKAADIVYKYFANSPMAIGVKSARSIASIPDFYNNMRRMAVEEPTLKYDTDGFIFVPDRISEDDTANQYLPMFKTRGRDRSLVNHPDLVKYKPPEKITIDFAVQIIGNSYTLLVSVAGGQKVPFNAKYPVEYTSQMVDIASIKEHNVTDGTVVEFKWDRDRMVFVAERPRFDKSWPNNSIVADGNWSLIHNPINEDTMKGNDVVLMRKYFNRVKKYILLKSAKSFTSKPTLLDIGSGRGGDVSKWSNNYSKVLAVEPNLSHIKEFASRTRRSKLNLDVQVVMTDAHADEYNRTHEAELNAIPVENVEAMRRHNASKLNVLPVSRLGDMAQSSIVMLRSGGEDHDLVTRVTKAYLKGRADVVSSMLSLSFFWESESKFKALMKTITQNLSPNGEFVFMTIDGDKVDQAFNPTFYGPKLGREVTYNENHITMSYNPPVLNIDIKGTIVERQTEWLVRISDMQLALDKYKLVDVSDTTGENLVSSGGRILMKLYTTGRFVPANAKKVKDPRRKAPRTPRMKAEDRLNPLSKFAAPSSVSSSLSTVPSRESITLEKKKEIVRPRGPIIIKRKRKKKRVMTALPVRLDTTSDKGIGDDVVDQINIPWFTSKQVLRIACIGDGSALFHAIMKSFYPDYASNESYSTRVSLVKHLRRDLARVLSINDANTGKMVYQSVMGGALPDLATRQFQKADLDKDSLGNTIDYSVQGLQNLINSNRDLGKELYGILAEILTLDIYVLTGQGKTIVPVFHTYLPRKRNRAAVILGDGRHYELVGVRTDNGIQTLYTNDDPFIVAIRNNKR